MATSDETEPLSPTPPPESAPESVEDVNTPEPPDSSGALENDPSLQEPATRAPIDGPEQPDGENQPAPEAAHPDPAAAFEDAAVSDTDTIADEPESTSTAPAPVEAPADLGRETSAHRVGIELKRIETEIRTILEGRDTRRKRRLTGTRYWQELEEDIRSWRHTMRFDPPTLDRLDRLITRRHHLFGHLRYIVSTRPVWNS